MNIRISLIITTLSSVLVLTGCATKQALKVDKTDPVAVTMTKTVPEAADKINVKNSTDSVHADSAPMKGGDIGYSEGSGTESRLETVYFDLDSCLLNESAREILARNASLLGDNLYKNVIIEGHADERGSGEYNLALSEKRALAAVRYIETLGVRHNRIQTVSYGENKPAADGYGDAVWAKNRRVEFVAVK